MSALVGTGSLVRLALRRDRIIAPVWILAIASVVIGTASAFAKLYPNEADALQFGQGIANNPSFIAMTGPMFGPGTVGGLTAWRMGGLGAILAALMSVILVVRHTRAEEEAGRLELIGSAVVGRHAPLTAALIIGFGANLVLGLVIGAGLVGQKLPSTGAYALGLALALTGWVFCAVAGVAAQLSESARAATGISSGILGLSYVLRGAGDAGGDDMRWLSWLSPIGWGQQVRPFANERWWVLLLPIALAVVLVGAAYALVAGRDHGAGLIATRPGPSVAAAGLRSPIALAWRLHRSAMLWWAGGFLFLGAAFGAVAKSTADLLNSNPELADFFNKLGGQGGLTDAFFSSMMGLLGLVAAAYAIQASLRLRAEETSLRAEPLLATGVRRTGWAGSHITMAAVGPAVLLAASGVGAGIVHGLRMGDVGTQLPKLLGAALVQLPAVWVLVGISVALFGLVPKATVVSWIALVIFLLLSQLGQLLQLSDKVMDFSPFTHVPKIPGADFSAAPVLWLVLVALVLAGAGLAGFRRRDIG